jgi:hypothetical protein
MRKLFVAMVVVGLCSVAWGKPTLGVLGIEVQVTTGKADGEDVRIAKDLTDGLRSRAKAGQGRFALGPNTDKDLLEEKISKSCENEAKSCMAAIAADLNVDFLMFGKIEKKALGNTTGYQISLKLLDAHKGSLTVWTDFMPSKETTAPQLQRWAKQGYTKLANEGTTGVLVLRTNVERGTILLDNAERGLILNSSGTIRDLAEGKYRLSIEAEGYKRWTRDEPIVILAGETLTIVAVVNTPVDKQRLPTENPRQGCCEAASAPSAGTLGLWIAMFGIWVRRRR